jgi:3-deoxy-D-manno-octulosonic-acid transferase
MRLPTIAREAPVNERLPLALRTYRVATKAAAPLAQYLLKYRLGHGKEHPTRFVERRGTTEIARPPGPLVWVHGASVGELVAAIPLIERIRERQFVVLVTTGTTTSAELAERRLPPDVIHQFVPYDVPAFVARFLDHWRPDLALFVESDLWPNMILGSAERGIPLIVVNGRLSERSFKRWQAMPQTIEALFRRVDLCLARTAVDADRFEALGAPRIMTTGNLKLDVPALPVDERQFALMRTAVIGRTVIAAASTHLGEEAAVIDAHRRLKNSFPGLLTIIVPRHPERGAGIVAAATAAGLVPAQRSAGRLPDPRTDIYVCDTLGELGIIFRVTPIVFMGGSLIPHGGQNPIEAIKLGAAILHGPHVANFKDIYAALDQHHGAELVPDAGRLTVRLGAWLKDAKERERVTAAGRRTVDVLAGALDRTLAALDPYFIQLRLEDRSSDA